MTAVARYPDSTKTSLEQRLRARARERWPQIASLHFRHRGTFSYVDATLTDGTTLKLCRLRYVGSASQWQFAIYRASHDDYDESVFPTGLPVGTCQDALDTACGLYLNDPTAWIQPPTNLRARPLRWDSAGTGRRAHLHAPLVTSSGSRRRARHRKQVISEVLMASAHAALGVRAATAADVHALPRARWSRRAFPPRPARSGPGSTGRACRRSRRIVIRQASGCPLRSPRTARVPGRTPIGCSRR
jgi:hypothetical protein